jgi:hypothetical protein
MMNWVECERKRSWHAEYYSRRPVIIRKHLALNNALSFYAVKSSGNEYFLLPLLFHDLRFQSLQVVV